MSSGDGMDSTLKYILSDVCGFLLLHPFVPDTTAASRSPERAMFICCGEPPSTFDWRPGSTREVGGVDKW
jgi:hypothetical protein